MGGLDFLRAKATWLTTKTMPSENVFLEPNRGLRSPIRGSSSKSSPELTGFWRSADVTERRAFDRLEILAVSGLYFSSHLPKMRVRRISCGANPGGPTDDDVGNRGGNDFRRPRFHCGGVPTTPLPTAPPLIVEASPGSASGEATAIARKLQVIGSSKKSA